MNTRNKRYKLSLLIFFTILMIFGNGFSASKLECNKQVYKCIALKEHLYKDVWVSVNEYREHWQVGSQVYNVDTNLGTMHEADRAGNCSTNSPFLVFKKFIKRPVGSQSVWEITKLDQICPCKEGISIMLDGKETKVCRFIWK